MHVVMCSSLISTHEFIFKLSFTTDFMQAVSFFNVMSCVDVTFLHALLCDHWWIRECVYLYSLSCRIPTGSKPWGFWIGVTRFCLCCIGSITDPCCPGGWGVPELPGMGPAGTAEVWGGAGEGRPLATGVSCFCAMVGFSAHWPGEQRLLLIVSSCVKFLQYQKVFKNWNTHQPHISPTCQYRFVCFFSLVLTTTSYMSFFMLNELKYLGATIQSNWQWTKEVKKRVQQGGDECQGWSVTEGQRQEWKGRVTRCAWPAMIVWRH